MYIYIILFLFDIFLIKIFVYSARFDSHKRMTMVDFMCISPCKAPQYMQQL